MSADQSVEVIEWTRAERRRLRESAAEFKGECLNSPWSWVSNMRRESRRRLPGPPQWQGPMVGVFLVSCSSRAMR
jgi:hypothetical protein